MEENKSRRLTSNIDTDNLSQEENNIMYRMLMGVDVTELFSPIRVNAVCCKFGLTAGLSMDLLTGFDFNDSSDRQQA